MPIYDYKCEKCGRVFEITHSFDDKAPDSCRAENCDGTLRRMFSPPTIIFKGSGWHINDYGRGNGPAPKRPSEKSAEKSAEKAAEKIDASSD